MIMTRRLLFFSGTTSSPSRLLRQFYFICLVFFFSKEFVVSDAKIASHIPKSRLPVSLSIRGGASMSSSNLKSALAGAIQKGAPVYNSGRPDLCYQIYKTVANRALNQELAGTSQAELLSQALETASKQARQDSDGAAWTMRRAFDLILEDRVPQQQQQSQRDASVTEWEVLNFEAGIPSSPRWRALDDVVMGGVSQSSLVYNQGDACMSFCGEVSTARNGGFASVRSEPWAGWDFDGAEGVELIVQGDGKKYKLNIKTDDAYDSVVYQKDFSVSPRGWQNIRLRFEEFHPTIRGNIINNYPKLNGSQIRQIGFMISKLSDQGSASTQFTAGDFQLNIQSIKAFSH